MALFGRRRRSDERPEAEETYVALRRQALELTADGLGERASGAPVIALLMETGYPEGAATLVGVVDGTTSLYFSNGGGVIGAGEHSEVSAATDRWLRTGADFLPHLAPAHEPPLPGRGQTQFVAVTPDGLLSASAREEELGDGEHELSPLFYAGHDVITQVRLAQGA